MSKLKPKRLKKTKKVLSSDHSPTISDFSPKAIRRALKKQARNHWSTRYSTVFLLLSLLGGGLFGFSEIIFFAIIGSTGVGCLSWVYNYYIKSGKFELEYINELQKALREKTEKKRLRLKEDLIELDCKDGALQLDKFQAKFDCLIELLADKLNTGEVTFGRYFGIAQEILLSGIDNLSAVASALKSVREIDKRYIDKQIKTLHASSEQGNDVIKEIETLEERLSILEKQEKKVSHLLLENEEAMTQLDQTTVAISDMDTGQGEAKVDMENSMKVLAELTERTHLYSK
ncbi:MAG: hypothetical protein HQ568_09630 [Calditrichaeota bacterium]|nr:hypothetical protein [Calditrichota bacterium]